MSDQPPAGRPRKLNRPALVAIGLVVVAAGVSGGIAATSGHSNDTSLSSPAADSTQTSASSVSGSSSGSLSGSSSQASAPASSRAASGSAGSAPWASTSCPSQMVSWRSTGAAGQLQVVVTDLTIASQAATSMRADPVSGTIPQTAVTALSSANALLRVSTQSAGKNLIPGCVSGAYKAEVSALTDLGHAVAGFDSAVSESASGDYGTAQQSSQTAVAALQSGSAKMATAIVDVSQYGAK